METVLQALQFICWRSFEVVFYVVSELLFRAMQDPAVALPFGLDPNRDKLNDRQCSASRPEPM